MGRGTKWFGHILAIGLILSGMAVGYSSFIVLGVVSELVLYAYLVFFFPAVDRPLVQKTHRREIKDGMIDLRGFRSDGDQQEEKHKSGKGRELLRRMLSDERRPKPVDMTRMAPTMSRRIQ